MRVGFSVAQRKLFPYQSTISDPVVDKVIDWVIGGGRLVLTGFELGERHHESNMNRLASAFGLQIRSDVIVAAEDPVVNKQYDREHSYDSFAEPRHPVLAGVESLILRNACSLYLEPGCRPIVMVGRNRIYDLHPDAASYSPSPHGSGQFGFRLAAGMQTFLPPVAVENRAVVAEAPAGLTGKGSVIAIGSWDFRCAGEGNQAFLKNLARWLQNEEAGAS